MLKSKVKAALLLIKHIDYTYASSDEFTHPFFANLPYASEKANFVLKMLARLKNQVTLMRLHNTF